MRVAVTVCILALLAFAGASAGRGSNCDGSWQLHNSCCCWAAGAQGGRARRATSAVLAAQAQCGLPKRPGSLQAVWYHRPHSSAQ
jgi:hypothetical protein